MVLWAAFRYQTKGKHMCKNHSEAQSDNHETPQYDIKLSLRDIMYTTQDIRNAANLDILAALEKKVDRLDKERLITWQEAGHLRGELRLRLSELIAFETGESLSYIVDSNYKR